MDLSRQAERIHGARVYVLYLDVLGFKAQVERQPAHIFDVMAGARRLAIQMAEHRHISHTDTGPRMNGFTRMNPPVTFSDSIFACTRDDSPMALQQLCHYGNTVFRHLLLKGLVGRGALSAGPVYWDDHAGVHLGKGISQAYELAEGLDCIGIAVDPGIESVAPNSMLGPFPFRTKSGGTVSLHAPGVDASLGLSVGSVSDCYDALATKARAEGKLHVVAKYESSRDLVHAMVSGP